MNKILFITNLIPFPLDNGGKIKSYNTLMALSKNYSVDVLCFANSSNDIKYKDILSEELNSITVVPKTIVRSSSKTTFIKEYFKSVLTSKPYSINKFLDKSFIQHLQNYLSKNEYEFVYIDHLPMMVYLKYLGGIPVLLDQHNVESLIFKRFIETETNVVKKVLGLYEYRKLRNFEVNSMLSASHIICLSKEDFNEFANMGVEKEKLSVLPIHLTLNKKYNIKRFDFKKIKILFLGSMSWYPNQSGLKWFMENVWNKLNPDEYELYIVGGNPPSFIKSYNNNTNVFVTGYVDDVDKYIEKCDVSIVPLFIGSGQRVKIIESFGKGIPVISTSIGAEGLVGTSGKDLLIADTKEEFIEQLESIKLNREILIELSTNAMHTFNNYYSSEKLPDKLIPIISQMSKSKE